MLKRNGKKEERRRAQRAHRLGSKRNDCERGDESANELLKELLPKGLATAPGKVKLPMQEKSFKDKMAWARDQLPERALARLDAEDSLSVSGARAEVDTQGFHFDDAEEGGGGRGKDRYAKN